MKKHIALIMAGCGHQDGSEITETVSALIALSECQAEVHCFAPNIEAPAQNHLSKAKIPARNALEEAARIARGQIRPLDQLQVKDYDGLVIPGGSGAAQILAPLTQVQKIIKDFYAEQKPILAICISPLMVAQVLGKNGITLTLGQQPGIEQKIHGTGAIHETCSSSDFISDRDHRIITTPAYMDGQAQPFEVYTGIRKAVHELIEMA